MITPVDKFVIERVREKRIERGMSQEQLAFAVDLPKSFISMIESGKYQKKYNVHHLNELARILKCSPQDFLPLTPLNEMK